MKHGSSNRRQRGRGGSNNRRGGNGNQNGGGNSRSKVFDSNGPQVRIRGTAHQVVEKYEALAKDASSAGDRMLAESYLQHAEHYVRIIGSWETDVQPPQNKANQANNGTAEKKEAAAPVGNAASSKEDLSLPTSILGEPAKAVEAEKSDSVPA